MIVVRIVTELGAIEVRRDGVRPSGDFWWRWDDLDVEMGPFRTAGDALDDAVDSVNAVRESIRRHQASSTSSPDRT